LLPPPATALYTVALDLLVARVHREGLPIACGRARAWGKHKCGLT